MLQATCAKYVKVPAFVLHSNPHLLQEIPEKYYILLLLLIQISYNLGGVEVLPRFFSIVSKPVKHFLSIVSPRAFCSTSDTSGQSFCHSLYWYDAIALLLTPNS